MSLLGYLIATSFDGGLPSSVYGNSKTLAWTQTCVLPTHLQYCQCQAPHVVSAELGALRLVQREEGARCL
jgi:hypothetical protein